MLSVWLARANEWLLPSQSSHLPVISQNNKPQFLAGTLGVLRKYTCKDSCTSVCTSQWARLGCGLRRWRWIAGPLTLGVLAPSIFCPSFPALHTTFLHNLHQPLWLPMPPLSSLHFRRISPKKASEEAAQAHQRESQICPELSALERRQLGYFSFLKNPRLEKEWKREILKLDQNKPP